MSQPRPVFFISDGTGITAETIGHSLLTQFTGIEFRTLRIPFVDTREKALAAADEIRAAGLRSGLRPIVVNSAVDPELSALIVASGAPMTQPRISLPAATRALTSSTSSPARRSKMRRDRSL